MGNGTRRSPATMRRRGPGATHALAMSRRGPPGGAVPPPDVAFAGGAAGEAQARAAARTLYGRDLTPAEYAGLAGASPGGRVEVRALGSSALFLTLTGAPGSGLAMTTYADRGPAGPVLSAVSRTYATPGDLARSLAVQVRQARALGVVTLASKVFSVAPAPPGEWDLLPRLGYDAPVGRIRHELREGHTSTNPPAVIPAALAGAQTYYELWRDGHAWLESVVDNPDLAFDPAPGSASSQRLDAYLQAHGLGRL